MSTIETHTTRVTVTVNGREVSEEVEPRTLLVHFLREQARLTGTHVGCDTSNCGACTVLIDDEAAVMFTRAVAERFSAIGAQVLLGKVGRERLVAAIARLEKAGARVVAGGGGDGPCSHRPTLLEVPAALLVARPQELLIEAFGNATVLVRCQGIGQLSEAVACVPGALAASLYCARDGRDDTAFGPLATILVERAGRIIENRMPTGLAVTPPMQHGGPWPSAGPPFFSAVGMPWSILRFARRICFDGWSRERLPECLRDEPPQGRPWRFVDAAWTRG